MKPETSKDFAGNTVYIGDEVFFVTRGRYPEAKILCVESFTESGLPKGEILGRSRPGWSSLSKPGTVVRSEFVKVAKE
jgi:hypothetical protein